MKVVKGLVVAALVVSVASGAFASSIAAKVWYAEVDGIDDAALHYGASGSLSLSEKVWISGAYLMGTFDDALGTGVDFDSADGELIMGYTADIIDIGIGARYSEWTFGDADDEFQIFGPMVYLGAGNTFGYDCPLGWYIGGSYMFKDLGDADDADLEDTFEHYTAEGGLFLSIESLTATAGYRIKDYVNFDDSMFSGFAATVGFGF